MCGMTHSRVGHDSFIITHLHFSHGCVSKHLRATANSGTNADNEFERGIVACRFDTAVQQICQKRPTSVIPCMCRELGDSEFERGIVACPFDTAVQQICQKRPICVISCISTNSGTVKSSAASSRVRSILRYSKYLYRTFIMFITNVLYATRSSNNATPAHTLSTNV